MSFFIEFMRFYIYFFTETVNREGIFIMAWVYLFFAGLFEMSWPTGFKLAQITDQKVTWVLFSAIGMTISGIFLYLAQKAIPVGTAYAVWAGIGAVGTFLLGIYYFGDQAGLLSWFGVVFIVGGIACLKMAHFS